MTLSLPFDMKDRRFSIGDHCGDTFAEDDDFDGIALTIEIKSRDEAKAVLAAILGEPERKGDEQGCCDWPAVDCALSGRITALEADLASARAEAAEWGRAHSALWRAANLVVREMQDGCVMPDTLEGLDRALATPAKED